MKNILGKSLSILTAFLMVFNVALATPAPNVTICHNPDSNNPQTLVVNANALTAHLGHGDTEGPCDGGEVLSCDSDFNLIANGGFEAPIVANASGWQIFDDGHPDLGWNVSWNGAFVGAPVVAKLELHGGVNGWDSYEGEQHAELDADWGYATNEEASVSISQYIPTVAGNTYEVSYAFSARPNTGADQNVLEVLVDGTLEDTQGPTSNNTNQTQWITDNFIFEATSDMTEITFQDAGIPNTFGTFLDDVSVVCIDEPEELPDVCYLELYARVRMNELNPNHVRNWRPELGADMKAEMFVGGNNPDHHTDGGDMYNAFEWFPLTENGEFINDADIASYRDVPGLAVQREDGKIRVVLYGFHDQSEGEVKELAAGSIELSTDKVNRLTNSWTKGENFSSPARIGDIDSPHIHSRIQDTDVNDADNPMDSRGNFNGNINQYNTRFDNVRIKSSLFQFHLIATTGSDGFYAEYDFDEMTETPCQS